MRILACLAILLVSGCASSPAIIKYGSTNPQNREKTAQQDKTSKKGKRTVQVNCALKSH